MRILGIAAHPDDIELGCAGSLAKHVNRGDEVALLILSKGEASDDGTVRVSETIEAAKILGITNIFFSEIPDTRIFDNVKKAIDVIEEFVEKFKPDRVYTNSDKDRHQDHIGTSIATKAACRNLSQVFAYETPSTLANFSPQGFVDISTTIESKIKAIKSHKSQKYKHYMKAEAILGLAKFRGLQAGLSAAEAFEIYRFIIVI